MRHYFSYEEDEANKQGHNDERNHRNDYEHDKYAYDGEDRAYWDGRKDEQEAEDGAYTVDKAKELIRQL